MKIREVVNQIEKDFPIVSMQDFDNSGSNIVNLDEEISDVTVMEYVKVINDYNIKQEIARLEREMKSEKDEKIKIELLERIRKLRIGE